MLIKYTERMLLALTGLLVCVMASAAGVSEDALSITESQLVSEIQSVKAIHCDFSQSLVDKNAKLLQSFQGEIAYQRPDQFYWHAGEPLSQTIASNGDKIWHLDTDLEQLIVQSYLDQADQALLLSVLQKPASLFDNYHAVSSETKEHERYYSLSAKHQSAALASLRISFYKTQLTRFEFVDGLTQTTTIVLSNCDKYLAMPSFVLEAPEGFDIIHE